MSHTRDYNRFMETNGISLNDQVGIFESDFDPAVSGQAGPVGSLLLRHDIPSIWQKSGVADIDWVNVTESVGTPPLSSVLNAGNFTNGSNIILSNGDQISGLVANGITYPTADGLLNQVITTNGANNLSFNSASDLLSSEFNAIDTDISNLSSAIDNTSGDVIILSATVGDLSIDDLTDVDTTTVTPITGDFLRWTGTEWLPSSSPQLSSQPVSNNLLYAIDTLTQPLQAINVFQTVTFDNIVVAEGWTYSNGNFTSTQGGNFMITFDMNVEKNGGGNVEIATKANLNGIEIVGSHNGMDITSNNTAFSISRTFLFSAQSGDVFNLLFTGNNLTARITPPPTPGGITTPVGVTILMRRIV